jgi:general stress protein YciG
MTVIPCSFSESGRTASVPIIEVMTPTPRTMRGKTVGLEDVGGHPGAVPHVVAHVVGDDRGVARVVLGDAGLDLADQVGAYVGGLGVDAAADTHKERQQRAAEAEADEDLVRVGAVDEEYRRRAQQAYTDAEHPGDGPGLKRDRQRFLVGTAGRRGGAHVPANREAHPDEAHKPGEERAQEERRRAPHLHIDVLAGEEEEGRHNDADK